MRLLLHFYFLLISLCHCIFHLKKVSLFIIKLLFSYAGYRLNHFFSVRSACSYFASITSIRFFIFVLNARISCIAFTILQNTNKMYLEQNYSGFFYRNKNENPRLIDWEGKMRLLSFDTNFFFLKKIYFDCFTFDCCCVIFSPFNIQHTSISWYIVCHV